MHENSTNRFSFVPNDDNINQAAPSTSPISQPPPLPTTSNSTDFSEDVAKSEQQENIYTDLPEVVPSSVYEGKELSPDVEHKEVVTTYDGKQIASPEKQLAYQETLPEAYDVEKGEQSYFPPIAEPTKDDKEVQPSTEKEPVLERKVRGFRVKWVFLAAGLLLLFIIALGAGLGAGLSGGSKGGTNAQDDSGTKGALAGTRLSIVSQALGPTGDETLVMYFQHHTGQIRWMELADNGSWIGGDASSLIASDAKNNTPITAASYVWDGASFWRVFYIDYTDTLKEIWNGNATNQWTLGPLNDLNIAPWDAGDVGMVACWDGPESHETDVIDLDIRLVYASDASTFKQLSFHQGSAEVWQAEDNATLTGLDGRATPACYSQGPGSVDYMFFLDPDNAVNVFWIDTATGQQNTSSKHPLNTWTNSSIAIPNVDSTATLAYANGYLYAQGKFDHIIGGYDMQLNAEKTSANSIYASSQTVINQNPGMPGTGLAIVEQGDDILVVFQTGGGDIIQFEGGPEVSASEWVGTVIAVPFE